MKRVKRKLLSVIKDGLKKGFSHKQIATSITLGVVIGIIPVYGITTLIVIVIALLLRLNMVLMQAVHYILHPVQIILFIPFFKLGDIFIKGSAAHLSFTDYVHLLRTDLWAGLGEIWRLNLSAVVVWLIISIPIYLVLYRVSVNLVRKYAPVLVKA
jgi:uncharacterized protein (DUF2062 family)